MLRADELRVRCGALRRVSDMPRARRGAVLLLALVCLILLDCVVLGTLHLALLERRSADNATAALRLRLAAESAARVALERWDAQLDTVAIHNTPLRLAAGETAEGYSYTAAAERIGSILYLVRAEAAEPHGSGRASATLLVVAPAFPPGVEFASAALSVAGAVRGSGSIDATAPLHCPRSTGIALRVTALESITLDAASVAGEVAYLPPTADLAAQLPRAFAALAGASGPALQLVEGDFRLSVNSSGVLLVNGSLTVASGTHFDGVILVAGGVLVDSGAIITGAVHAGGDSRVDGTVRMDACLVESAVSEARLTLPRLSPTRAWLPSF